MNMTIAELLTKLLAKNAIVTYEGDESKYIDGEFILIVEGQNVSGILEYESGAVAIEFEDTSCSNYEADEVVGVFFYRQEEL